MISIRPALAEDWPWIAEGYVESYRTSHWSGPVPIPLWDSIGRQCLAWLAEHHRPDVLVAHGPDGDRYGWIAVSRGLTGKQRIREGGRWVTKVAQLGPVVHYCYVGEPYRRLGIARQLFAAAAVDPRVEWSITHKTALAERILRPRGWPWRFAPLLAKFAPRDAANGEPSETR